MKKLMLSALLVTSASTFLQSNVSVEAATNLHQNVNSNIVVNEEIFTTYNAVDKFELNSLNLPTTKDGILSVMVNGIPNTKTYIDKSGTSLVNIMYIDKISKKMVEETFLLKLKKSLTSKYVGEKHGINLHKEVGIPIKNLVRIPTSDYDNVIENIKFEVEKNPYVSIYKENEFIYLKGIKEINSGIVDIVPSYKGVKGDKIPLKYSVYSNAPTIVATEIISTGKHKFYDSTTDGTLIDTFLLEENKEITINTEISDLDGGNITLNVFNAHKLLHTEKLKDVSKDIDKPTKHSITFSPKEDINNLKIIAVDNTNKEGYISSLPNITLVPFSQYDKLTNNIELAQSSLEKYEQDNTKKKDKNQLNFVSISTLRDINNDLVNLGKGKSLSIDFTEMQIKNNTVGEAQKKLLNEYKSNLDLWLGKTKQYIFPTDYKYLELSSVDNEDSFDIDFLRTKYMEETKRSLTKMDVQSIIDIEQKLNLIEQRYDSATYNFLEKEIAKLENTKVKDRFKNRLVEVDISYKLANTFLLTEENLIYFVNEFKLDTPYKKGYLDEYILSINKQINLENDRTDKDKIGAKFVLLRAMEDNYLYLKELENRKKNLKKGEKFDIKQYKKFKQDMIDSKMATTPLSFRHGIARYKDGAKINMKTLKTDVSEYYNPSYKTTYDKYLTKVNTKVTYKQLLNMVDLLNKYELAKKNENIRKDVSYDIFTYFPIPSIKYDLLDMLNKEELGKYNNNMEYRKNTSLVTFGVPTAIKSNKTHYTNVVTKLIDNYNVKMTTENLYFISLLVNENVRSLTKYEKYSNIDKMTKEFENNYKNIVVNFSLSAENYKIQKVVEEYLIKKHENQLKQSANVK